MRQLASGYLAGWSGLSAEQKAAAIELARITWDDDRTWSALPEHAKVWATLALPMVVSVLDPILDTFRCANCQDTGFQPGKNYGLWFCAACDKGLVLEAGYWRRLRYPEVRGRRIASAAGKRRFEEYASSKPGRAEVVRLKIAQLVQQERERETETIE